MSWCNSSNDLGHSDVVLRCDNETAILQLQRLATKTRQSMGLKTYDHGNSLAENGIGSCSTVGSKFDASAAWKGLDFSCLQVQLFGHGL